MHTAGTTLSAFCSHFCSPAFTLLHSGFRVKIIENVVEGDEVRTNLSAVEEAIKEIGMGALSSSHDMYRPRKYSLCPHNNQLLCPEGT